MGVAGSVPNSRSIDAELWSRILSRFAGSDIRIEDREEEEAMTWCRCVRGRASFALGVAKPTYTDRDFYFSCSLKHYWPAPLSTRRLIRDVVTIVEAVLAEPDA